MNDDLSITVGANLERGMCAKTFASNCTKNA